jgi:hypothetical protein
MFCTARLCAVTLLVITNKAHICIIIVLILIVVIVILFLNVVIVASFQTKYLIEVPLPKAEGLKEHRQGCNPCKHGSVTPNPEGVAE